MPPYDHYGGQVHLLSVKDSKDTNDINDIENSRRWRLTGNGSCVSSISW